MFSDKTPRPSTTEAIPNTGPSILWVDGYIASRCGGTNMDALLRYLTCWFRNGTGAPSDDRGTTKRIATRPRCERSIARLRELSPVVAVCAALCGYK